MNQSFYILFLILLPVLGYGQVSIISETNTKEYEVKEAFKLNIGLEIIGDNAIQAPPVKLPDLSKFEILGNASEVFSFIDPDTGVLVKQVVYQLLLEPKQAGKIKIGSVLVQIDGKIYKSEAFDIFVKNNIKKESESLAKNNVQLSMELKNKPSYAFEPINIIIKAHSKNLNNFRKVHHLKLPHHEHSYSIKLDKQDIETWESQDGASQVLASFLIYPDKSGNYIIPAALATFESEKISSNTLKTDIKPLPKGAPKHFKNSVGNFDIEIISPKEEIEVLQPFDVFVKLSGKGNFDQIKLPKILKSNHYQIINKPIKSSKITATSSGLQGEITEHYVLIAKNEGNINISLEEFAFFNPQTNEYHNIEKNNKLYISKKILTNNNSSIVENIFQNSEEISISEKPLQENKSSSWNIILIGFLSCGALGLLILIFLKKKKSKIITQKEKITTIAETEEILRHHLFIGKEYYFRSLEKALKENNSSMFFNHYNELHFDTEEQVALEGKSIIEFLENTTDSEFVQEFKEFRSRIEVEKYAPVHEDLYNFYNNIVKFYSKIMK